MYFDHSAFGDTTYRVRAAARSLVELQVRLSALGTNGGEGRILNISPLGARIDTPARLEVGSFVLIHPARGRPIPALVRWNTGETYGCQFLRRLPRSDISRILAGVRPGWRRWLPSTHPRRRR